MCTKNIEYCMHCVSYSPKTYKEINTDGVVKIFIGCKNQRQCALAAKQFDKTTWKEEKIINLLERTRYIMECHMTVRDLLTYVAVSCEKEKGYIIVVEPHRAKKYYSYNDTESSSMDSITASGLRKQIQRVGIKQDGQFVMYTVYI